VQLGTTVASLPGTPIFDGTAPLVIGGTDGGNFQLAMGDVYSAQLYNNGVLVADFEPNDWVSGNTWVSSSTGETWTRNGSALISPEIKIGSITTGTHTLTKSGVGVIQLHHGNIQHSMANPANTWYAGADGTNNQGVATAGNGWLFQ
jgi:hypothetical protein